MNRTRLLPSLRAAGLSPKILTLVAVLALQAGQAHGAVTCTASTAGISLSGYSSEQTVGWSTSGSVTVTCSRTKSTDPTQAYFALGLDGGLNRSGWPPQEIREAMNKLYSVDLAAVDRFLGSAAGQATLQGQADTYYPYWSQGRTGVQALRAAILADAADGRISAATTMALLPTNMRLASGCPVASGTCQPLLTWWVFLPARIQAGQIASPLAAGISAPATAGAPAAAAVAAPVAR